MYIFYLFIYLYSLIDPEISLRLSAVKSLISKLSCLQIVCVQICMCVYVNNMYASQLYLQKVELPDNPRSTFLLAFSPDR